jgi:hypothetical protein
MAKVTESKRGNKTLVLNNFTFFIGSVNKSNENIRWRCIKKNCFAKVYNDNKNEML